jgi:5-methylcytosine-specific restriction endonuclease McrA
LRLRILARDGHRCAWCGGPADTVDHVTPIALGGARLDPENLVAACAKCNYGRTNNLR